MKKLINKYLKIFGLTFLIDGYILIIYVFLSAYSNNYTWTIYINQVREAKLELIVILISIPIVTIYIIKQVKDIFK